MISKERDSSLATSFPQECDGQPMIYCGLFVKLYKNFHLTLVWLLEYTFIDN